MAHLTAHEFHTQYGIGSISSTHKLLKSWKNSGLIESQEESRHLSNHTYTVQVFCEVKICTLIVSTRNKDTYSAKLFSKHFRKISATIAKGCETPVKSP